MQRQALAALDAARPAIARLDRSRHAEELAADLIEAWTGIETALRALVGGTPLGGQALIRDARQRQLITFDLANALAEFQAARDRSQDTSYHPTDQDIDAAREGFLKLESSLMTPEPAEQTPKPGEAMSTKGLRTSPLAAPELVPPPARRKPWLIPVVAFVLIAGLGAGAWAIWGRRDTSLDQGIAYWQGGQRELAVAEFSRAARDNPGTALPHVYLSRMAREVGNMTLAGQEATLAVQAEPNNAIALREMASYLFQVGNYELARRFYVRALTFNAEDRASQGFLGCTLLKLGRTDEAMRWLNRAGTGSWSGCAQRMGQPGMMPQVPPQVQPPAIPR